MEVGRRYLGTLYFADTANPGRLPIMDDHEAVACFLFDEWERLMYKRRCS